MTREKIEEVIWLFTSKNDNVRPRLQSPRRHKNYYFASDAFCMAVTDSKNVDADAFARSEPLEHGSIVGQFIEEWKPNVRKSFELSEIRRVLSEIPKEREQVKDCLCEKCEGSWYVSCPHCGNESDCDECEDGWKYKPGDFTERFDFWTIVHFGDAFMDPNYVKKLADSAEILGVSIIEHIRDFDLLDWQNTDVQPWQRFAGAQEFRVWPVRITIMPHKVLRGTGYPNHDIHELNYVE